MGKVMIAGAVSAAGNTLNVAAGSLTFVKRSEAADVVNTGMRISVYNKAEKKFEAAYLDIALWNNDRVKLCDRAEKALKKGAFCSFLLGDIKPGEPSPKGIKTFKATALDFQYKKFWKLSKEGKDVFCLVGTIRKDILQGNGLVVATIPVNVSADETKWYEVEFKDKLFEEANDILKSGLSIAAVIGEPVTNDKGYERYPAISFYAEETKSADEKSA
jgi:hypothetical protein